jgi:hypothetical protein
MAVELCHVVERGTKKKPKKAKTRRTRAKSKPTKQALDSGEESEPVLSSEDQMDQPDIEAGEWMDVDGGFQPRGVKRNVHDELPATSARPRIVNRAEVVITVPSPKKRKTEPP